MREFKSEYEDAHCRDKSKSLEDEDKIVKDLGQNQWGWVRISDRKKDFHLNWLTENSTKYTDKLDINYIE